MYAERVGGRWIGIEARHSSWVVTDRSLDTTTTTLTIDAEHVDELHAGPEVLDPAPQQQADDEDVAVEDAGRGAQLYRERTG